MKKFKEIIKNKKFWLVAATCVCVIGFSAMRSDPVVVAIDREDSIGILEKLDNGTIHSFYDDEDARYYLADGAMAWDYTVHCRNRSDEPLPLALDEGHITLEDLDRFDIEYVVRYKD